MFKSIKEMINWLLDNPNQLLIGDSGREWMWNNINFHTRLNKDHSWNSEDDMYFTSYNEVIIPVNKYAYYLPSTNIWTSIDQGTLEATSLEEARRMLVTDITKKLKSMNDLLNIAETSNYKIEMDLSKIVIEKL